MSSSRGSASGRRRKPPSSEAVAASLAALAALDPSTERAVQSAAIQQALELRHFSVAAKAATLTEQRMLRDLAPALIEAFTYFLEDPLKRDPNCIGKQPIARALVTLDCSNVDFFLQGIRYVQREPVWGGTTDTAVDVRCSCAMGLAGTGYYRTVAELARLLVDPEARARAGAVRAIACSNPHEAEPLLRFKALSGDADPQVIGECFTGLLSIAADECLPLVSDYLAHDDESLREYAALALGESRHPGALERLRAAWDDIAVTSSARATLIRAAALHRSEAAFEWLLSIIEQGNETLSNVAVDALSVYDRNARLKERVDKALASRAS